MAAQSETIRTGAATDYEELHLDIRSIDLNVKASDFGRDEAKTLRRASKGLRSPMLRQ
jgi:hypothetical protein